MMCSGAECLKSELSKEDSWDSGSTFGSLLTESEFGGVTSPACISVYSSLSSQHYFNTNFRVVRIQ